MKRMMAAFRGVSYSMKPKATGSGSTRLNESFNRYLAWLPFRYFASVRSVPGLAVGIMAMGAFRFVGPSNAEPLSASHGLRVDNQDIHANPLLLAAWLLPPPANRGPAPIP
jgi:hypothetical protein